MAMFSIQAVHAVRFLKSGMTFPLKKDKATFSSSISHFLHFLLDFGKGLLLKHEHRVVEELEDV